MTGKLIIDTTFGTQEALAQVWDVARDSQPPTYELQVTGATTRLDLLDLAIWIFGAMDKELRAHELRLHDAEVEAKTKARSANMPRSADPPEAGEIKTNNDAVPLPISFQELGQNAAPFANSLSLAPPQVSVAASRYVPKGSQAGHSESSKDFAATARKLASAFSTTVFDPERPQDNPAL